MARSKFEFEKAMARAEEIASSIEQGKIGLEESIKQFEEGMALIKRCRQVLDEAELKIQRLEAVGEKGVEVRAEPSSASDS